LQHFEKEVDIKIDLYHSDDHEEIATSYNNIGLIYSHYKNYSEAIRYYNMSIDIKKKRLSPDDISIAKTLHNLADRHYQLREYDKALSCFREALDIKEKYRKSSTHPDLCTTINALGLVYLEKDDLATAREHFEKSKEILEMNFPQMENHALTATTYNNLGEVYNRLREVDKAKFCIQKAVEILGKDEENSNMDMSISMFNLGSLHSQLGEKDKAEEAYKKALKIALELADGNEDDTQVKEIREELARL
jgi:tetratricopeptide (TPR) repeat protein